MMSRSRSRTLAGDWKLPMGPARSELALDRDPKVWKAGVMSSELDRRARSAVFRIHIQPAQAKPAARPSETTSGTDVVPLRQERLVIPLNRVMGRNQLDQPSSSLSVYGPGEGGEELFIVPTLDYFDRLASRQHCMIELDEQGQVRVRDLGSTYGTFLQRDSSATAKEWIRLAPGVSYLLLPGQRLRLGEGSVAEYEYTGVTSDVHIRLRYWSRDISFPLECTPFEWTALPSHQGEWSSAKMLGEGDAPLHDPPHLTVRTELRGGVPVASVELEATSETEPKRTAQYSGSMIHGADLDTSGEPDLVQHFRAGYELLLPGPSSKETGMGMIEHTFLRPERLRFHAVLDVRNWISFLSVGFAHLHTPHSYQTCLGSKGDGAYDISSLPPLDPAQVSQICRHEGVKALSISKAIAVALVERRRLDLQQGPSKEPGWISKDQVIALRRSDLSEEKFQNNFTKWRSDVAKKLKTAAAGLRETRAKTCAIPEEADWIRFVETKDDGDCMSIRFVPTVELQFIRGT